MPYERERELGTRSEFFFLPFRLLRHWNSHFAEFVISGPKPLHVYTGLVAAGFGGDGRRLERLETGWLACVPIRNMGSDDSITPQNIND